MRACVCTDPKSRLKKWSGVCEVVCNFSTGCYCTGFGTAAIHIYSQANKEAFRKRCWQQHCDGHFVLNIDDVMHNYTIFEVIER